VLDRLSCRAAFFDGEAPVAIVVLDLIHVFGSWVSQVRTQAAALGVQGDHLLITATHTHAGPGVFRSCLERDERVAAYERNLVATVAACLRAAQRTALPAQLRFGSAPVHGVAANRRDPSLPVDETVRVLCAVAADGQLRGAIANFACHPTVLSAANSAYSGDLHGVAAARAAHDLGAIVLPTNGAAGDVSTRFTRREQTHAEVERMGGVLAAAIRSAIGSAADAASDAGAAPAAVSRTVPLAWRPLPPPEVATAELQSAGSALEALHDRDADPATVRLAQARIEGAQAALWVIHQGGWEALFGPRQPLAEVQALRLGDVALVAAPGELFSAAGGWLRQRLGERTMVIGYANDYLGYFIPADDAHGGYEALIAMVDPSCEAAIRHGLCETARRLVDH